MASRPERVSASSISTFKSNYNDLHEMVQRFQAWMMAPTGGARARNTALAYASCVRTLLIRVLVRGEPPSVALMAGAWPSAGSAWRMFRAFTRLGGSFVEDGVNVTTSDVTAHVPEVITLVDELFTTPLGDLLHAAGMTQCVRALWRVGLPDGLAAARLRTAFDQPDDGLFALNPTARGLDAPAVRALARFALWSYAGSTPGLDAPLLTAWPYDPVVTAVQTAVPTFAMWDIASRAPASNDILLPPEGEALLAGEAIDFGAVVPFGGDSSTALYLRYRAPRYAIRRDTGDRQAQIQRLAVERVRYNHMHHKRPTSEREISDAYGPVGLAAVTAAFGAPQAAPTGDWSLVVDVADPEDGDVAPQGPMQPASRSVSMAGDPPASEHGLTDSEDFDPPAFPG